MKLFRVLFIVLALVSTTAVLPAFADAPVDGRVGRAEVRFLEGMIDHHQMALDMANDCLAKAATPAVVTICQNVITAQTREIEIMLGWLLSWYGIEYTPTSMLHSDHEADASSGMGMGMMGDGSMMSGEMMGSMSEMMEMMSGMMGQGGMMQGGMGMMGDGGMMGGATQGGDMGMGMMGEMPVEVTNALLSLIGTLTVGQLLELTADLQPSTPLIEVLDSLIASDEFPIDAEAVIPMMGGMTHGAWTMMGNEMHNLTLADIQEMQGHLDDGANVTLLTLMIHHMDVMANSGAAAEGDHEAHHPDATAEAPAATDHSEHEGAGSPGTLTDPSMTMGMFAGLNRLTGVEYEIAWLEAMIDHHDDALHMAERILEAAPEGVGHEQVRELAQSITTDQTAEIEAMEALIIELGG